MNIHLGRGNMDLKRFRVKTSWVMGVAGIALLVILACRVSWSEVITTLRGFSKPWLLVLIALTVLSVSLRALRLSLLLDPHASFLQTWRSVCLGYFGSLFLPLGGGEAVKVAAIRYESGASLSRAGTALTMDRLFDVCGLLVLLAAVAGWGPHFDFRLGPVMVLAIIAASLIALWGFLLISGASLKAQLTQWAGRHPGRHPWIHRFDEVHSQAKQLRNPRLILTLLLLQSCIFATDILGSVCGLAAFSFGRTLPVSAAFRLALFVMLGFGLPLLPGGLGSHQAASILALAPYGISSSQALALSLVGETVHMITLSGLGLVAIQGSGLNPLRLFRSPEVINSPHPPEVS